MAPENKPEQRIKMNIEKYGLHIVLVNATNYLPSFAYSIGLKQTYNHPEIICFGLPNETAQIIINDIANMIDKGEKIKSGEIYTNIFQNSKATFLNVDKRNIGDYFGMAINYYKNENFDALELIWTDRNNKFPWEENFEEEFEHAQPLLDRNADFKFREPKNLRTFTTRQWLEEQKPILIVYHDNEGDWQFLTGDEQEDDARIVALEELVKRDRTLNEVFDLDYGEQAERKSAGGEWIRKMVEGEE